MRPHVLASWCSIAVLVGAAHVASTEQRSCPRVVGDEVILLQGNQKLMMQMEVHGSAAQPSAKPRLQFTSRTTPSPLGLSVNAEGDLQAFLTAALTNFALATVFVLAFCVLRQRYPIIYSGNVLAGITRPVPSSCFGWVWASLHTTTDENIKAIGLDSAMLLEFLHLSVKILAIVGIPMFCIMGPVHFFLGGHAAGKDRLSYLSMGNVEFGSWLYWLHAIIVWLVVFTVQVCIYRAMENFLPRRYIFLSEMPTLRANTVMIEGIPLSYQSDDALKSFFDSLSIFHGRVESAYVTKGTTTVLKLVQERAQMQRAHKRIEAQWEKAGSAEDERPTMRISGERVDCMNYYTKQIAALDESIKNEREKIKKAALTRGGVNLSNGFVTFKGRAEAEVAIRLQEMTPDLHDFVMSAPPPAEDILWSDLTQDVSAKQARNLIGLTLIIGLFFAYIPAVLAITNLAYLVDVGPLLQPLWEGLAPTLGLQFMVSFLPTFLVLIFTFFFTLKAEAWSQHLLQTWYFWFQIFFVILLPAIGQDFTGFVEEFAGNPLGIFGILADELPSSTHFFMEYMTITWFSHGMVATRYMVWTKFKGLSAIYDEKEAKELAEPEDQDYYGLGSRSARWTIDLTVSIVYGTLSPPLMIIGLVSALFMRLIYGYIIPYAETRKSDLGGVFWVTQLRHTFISNLIYCILMTGYLARRAGSWGPCALAAPSIAYVLWSHHRFNSRFSWEFLPYMENVYSTEGKGEKRPMKGAYVQPEMLDVST